MTLAILIVFVAGYILIAFEHSIKINKAPIAVLTGIICWVFLSFIFPNKTDLHNSVLEKLGEISGILFFLLGAMTIVELIDLHNGFDIIVRLIKAQNKIILLVIISLITFFLSPLLDNLTTTIVMISILHKLLPKNEDRLYFASIIIIAANAGGAWSPIGDVTTSMLWIGGQLTVNAMILKLFLPSFIALIVPLLIVSYKIKNEPLSLVKTKSYKSNEETEKKIIFFSGMFLLLLVPIMKAITHLPPFMCMLLSLGIFWVISEILHKNKSSEIRTHLSVASALRRIDTPSIIFFLGILFAVSALEEAGFLHQFASYLTGWEMSHNSIAISLGFLSAIIDNVPLVAGAMGMFPIDHFPVDHNFWSMLAFTSGTGGSMLIIGSAAGVVAMGMEKITFGWFIRKISWIALFGFICGTIAFLLL
jgi:Na+/H+ antiporter NhaD/arsenite permease-like protein